MTLHAALFVGNIVGYARLMGKSARTAVEPRRYAGKYGAVLVVGLRHP
jgi:hypothetical protein